MRTRPSRAPRPELMDRSDPRGFGSLGQAFLRWLEVKGFTAHTVRTRKHGLEVHASWSGQQGIRRPVDVTRGLLEEYQRWMFSHQTDDGKSWSFRYQCSLLSTVRAFYGWLSKQGHILFDPSSELELPRTGKRLPTHVLTAEEVEKVLLQPDLASPAGLRDRALLETLYATGMRRMEVAGLDISDVNPELQTVLVRSGKGRKDRVVPLGERALSWIERYLEEGREYLVQGEDCGALFLSATGARFNHCKMGTAVRGYVDAAKLGKSGSCHLFRHTVATLMLENGADIRFIQALLGHASLKTTQLYTSVSIRKLKEVHTATHPGARLLPPPKTDEED